MANTKKAAPKDEPTLSPEVRAAMEKYMPYLEEAQRRLLISSLILLGGAIIGGFNYKTILTFIMGRFDLTGINIVLTSPYQVIELAVQTGIYTGIAITFPLVIYNIMAFLKPALDPEEYKVIVSMLPLSIFLFFSGFFFGVWIMNFIITIFTRASLEFSIGNIWDISRFFGQILFSGVTLGLIFQFPIVLTVLLRFQIITQEILTKRRPYFYAASLIVAAALPPTDIFSLIMLVLPMLVLFELTLLLNRGQAIIPTRKKKGGDR